MADYTAVIDSATATDEARACALSNRRHKTWKRPSRDRTTLLELRLTSADRRYVALVRRAKEHWISGRREACLADLQNVLDTTDIATEQKMEARYKRAERLVELRRPAEAAEDLAQIVASLRNLPNVDAAAQTELDKLGASGVVVCHPT